MTTPVLILSWRVILLMSDILLVSCKVCFMLSLLCIVEGRERERKKVEGREHEVFRGTSLASSYNAQAKCFSSQLCDRCQDNYAL